MRKYYLFTIKDNYYKIYKKNPKVLYKTLYNLYNIKKENIDYGLSLYNNLCDTINKKILINYIKTKFDYKLVNSKIIRLNLKDEKTLIQINYSCIVIFTNINISFMFKILNIYNKYLFVCDFINQDYFWLNEQIEKVR